jgi:hypothetical protein
MGTFIRSENYIQKSLFVVISGKQFVHEGVHGKYHTTSNYGHTHAKTPELNIVITQ